MPSGIINIARPRSSGLMIGVSTVIQRIDRFLYNIITSELGLQLSKRNKATNSPSDMALILSRAAWADLNGKKAARLTMPLNFPMFRTQSSTWGEGVKINSPTVNKYG